MRALFFGVGHGFLCEEQQQTNCGRIEMDTDKGDSWAIVIALIPVIIFSVWLFFHVSAQPRKGPSSTLQQQAESYEAHRRTSLP